MFLYRYFLPKLPFNWLAIALMQMPLTFFMFLSSVLPPNFDTVYNTATSIASLVAYVSVLMVFSGKLHIKSC
tara:strand:+ start:316 stop:531 length:216 start_codon:yes stop_codon:yes gene_type:complete